MTTRVAGLPLVAPEIELVVVFGSRARRRAHVRSDLDIAVQFKGIADLDRLYLALSSQLGADRLDLVDLRRAGVTLGFEVARSGRLLFERRQGLFREFQSLASRRYCDTAKLCAAQHRAIHAALEQRGVESPIEAAIIRRKLSHILAALEGLRLIGRLGRDEYRARLYERKAAERLLQAAIEAVLDINAHLVAEAEREVPDTYYGGLLALAELGILTREQAVALAPSAGLRNRLAHEYEGTDDAKVLSAIATTLDRYPRYVHAIEAYLDKAGP